MFKSIATALTLVLSAAAFAHEIGPEDTTLPTHGGDPIPRASKRWTNVLVVPAGETVTLPSDASYDAIEVQGTLRISRDHDTTLSVIDIQILPGGVLDMGTPADPVHRNVEIIVRDEPIDTTVDPYQWGVGLLNLSGRWLVHGKSKTAYTHMGEAVAGDTTIFVDSTAGWEVGDELVIPDTQQMIPWKEFHDAYARRVRRESPVTITAIAGNSITLSKPLDFEHAAIRNPRGDLQFRPLVANITRNIVIRSENPNGTRGHSVNLEHAFSDIRWAAFLGLGRTLPIPLSSTSKDSAGVITVGTNQIARYADHWHHNHPLTLGETVGVREGNYYDGSDIAKWGVVQHGTHWVTVRDCIADRFVGAGFVTEDGNECFGTYHRNLGMYCKGHSYLAGTKNEPGFQDGKFSFIKGIPGGEGAGFWFHGMHVEAVGNVATCNSIGFAPFYRSQVTRLIEGSPAGFNPKTVVPIAFEDNVAVANYRHGIEYWNAPEWTNVRFQSLHNGIAVTAGSGEPGFVSLRDAALIADPSRADMRPTSNLHQPIGLQSSFAYTTGVTMIGGEVSGFKYGLRGTSRIQGAHYEDLLLQNIVNVDLRFRDGVMQPAPTLRELRFLPLDEFPLIKILLDTGIVIPPDYEAVDNSERIAELRALIAAAEAQIAGWLNEIAGLE